MFEAASLSKPVFAYIVLICIAEGFFSRPDESPEQGLDRPLHEICDFGPALLRSHPNYKKLTARLILSHQSGLPNWFYPGQPEDYISEPGERFGYSGLAYTFLCEVLEHQTRQTLEQLAQAVFQPLGMSSSSFLPYHDGPLKSKLRAIGHDAKGVPDDVEHFRKGLGSASGANCAGSLMTTASDYARFLQACLRDDFIKKCLFSPHIALAKNDNNPIDAAHHIPPHMLNTLHWGLGFGLQMTQADTIAYQWGGADTSRALAVINVTQGSAVVCLTNSANGPKAFQTLTEPFVGSLTPILTCLHKRAGLPIQADETSSASYDLICEQLDIERRMPGAIQEKEADDVKSSPEVVHRDPPPTTPKVEATTPSPLGPATMLRK